MSAQPPFRPRCLRLDLETSLGPDTRLHKLGAWRADTDQSATFQGQFTAPAVRAKLDELAQTAGFLLGHNLIGHDPPILRQLYPDLALHLLPVVDTLWLSPLAFPQNPYQHLVKDYKRLRDARNDPLKDAQLSFRLFRVIRTAPHNELLSPPERRAVLRRKSTEEIAASRRTGRGNCGMAGAWRSGGWRGSVSCRRGGWWRRGSGRWWCGRGGRSGNRSGAGWRNGGVLGGLEICP